MEHFQRTSEPAFFYKTSPYAKRDDQFFFLSIYVTDHIDTQLLRCKNLGVMDFVSEIFDGKSAKIAGHLVFLSLPNKSARARATLQITFYRFRYAQ